MEVQTASTLAGRLRDLGDRRQPADARRHGAGAGIGATATAVVACTLREYLLDAAAGGQQHAIHPLAVALYLGNHRCANRCPRSVASRCALRTRPGSY